GLLNHAPNFAWGDGHQTIVMRALVYLTITFELEAWAARELVTDDDVTISQRRRSSDVGRPVDSDDRGPDRNRRVHKSAVVADQHMPPLNQRRYLLDRCLARRNRNSSFEPTDQAANHLFFRG